MTAPKVVYEMKTAVVVPHEKRQEIIMNFKPMADDPEFLISIPSASVGQFVAQLASAHQSFSMKADTATEALLPLKMTGARAMDSTAGPVILLQFENVFELAVLVDPQDLVKLVAVAEQASMPSTGAPAKPH